MKGLEIARAYWERYGLPMLRERFPEVLPLTAAGLCGSGSECFGFDDHISPDHDFPPGFCLFLPGEKIVDRQTAFRLERAYASLPANFMGLHRDVIQPVGGSRRGVIRRADFFTERTGSSDGIMSNIQWLSLPDWALAEATNGELFWDGSGEMTAIRKRLAVYPEDVRRKKLAASLLLMAQAGQYNYGRCLLHGETGAAQMAIGEFVRAALQAVFLLNRVYQPYYKWSFRALRSLPFLSLEASILEYLLTTDNSPELTRDKQESIESIASDVSEEVRRQGLAGREGSELEPLAYAVQDGIVDAELRSMHILSAV